jgi:hypothetical protein
LLRYILVDVDVYYLLVVCLYLSCFPDTVYTTPWHINRNQLLVLTQLSIQHNITHATTRIRRIKKPTRSRSQWSATNTNIMKCNKYASKTTITWWKYNDEWSESRTMNIDWHTPNTCNIHKDIPQEDDKHRDQLEYILTI